ncbi:MAG: MBL fold metallo-hydrolase, partial [Ferrovibrio sp.]
HGDPDAIGALHAAISLWGDRAPSVLTPKLDETYSLAHGKPRLLKRTQQTRRLDRYAEAEALSGRDWHNDYARLMLQVQQQLRTAKSDVERRRLLRKMQRVVGDR